MACPGNRWTAPKLEISHRRGASLWTRSVGMRRPVSRGRLTLAIRALGDVVNRLIGEPSQDGEHDATECRIGLKTEASDSPVGRGRVGGRRLGCTV